jgi:hypothetical protein
MFNGMSSGMLTGNVVAPEFFLAAQLCARLGRCTARLVPRLADAALRLTRNESWKSLSFRHANDFALERLDHSGNWRDSGGRARKCRH